MAENLDGTISARSMGRPAKKQNVINHVTQYIHNEARGNSNRGRLCGDLTMLEYHDSKTENIGKEQTYVVCGKLLDVPHVLVSLTFTIKLLE